MCQSVIPDAEFEDGQPEHMDGCCPNNSSFLPKQKDDLLEENKRGKERTPEPLPGGGQAPAEKRESGQQANTRRSKINNFRIHRRRQTPDLTPVEMEQRKKAQLKALLGSQVKKLEQVIWLDAKKQIL